jgi:ribokinase
MFICPAFPLEKLVDPTGAGDSFVGAMMGWLAASKGGVERNLPKAMVYGSVVASFCCEGFGLSRTAKITRKDTEQRVRELKAMTAF